MKYVKHKIYTSTVKIINNQARTFFWKLKYLKAADKGTGNQAMRPGYLF